LSLIVRQIAPKTEGARAFLADGAKGVLIDGEWRDGAARQRIPSHDPASGAHLADLVEAAASDVDDAVAAARRALSAAAWAGLTPSLRGRLLWRIADLIDAHADELAEIETLDQGKSWRTSRMAEIPAAAEQFRYFAGFVTKILGETIPVSIGYQPPGKQLFAYTRREPVGVVAAITPWNSPLLMAAMKLAPALAAGCAVVLKPAEETSLTALRLGRLMQDAGLPPGVVNILTGRGETVGAALAAHPDVDKATFTGSTETGRLILRAAAGNLKKLTLELGGKSPVVVFEDADLSLAAPGIARGVFANGGQVCVAGSRVYVHRSRHDELADALAAEARRLRLGHGLDPDADLGPLVGEAHARRVEAYLAEGLAEGARAMAGGARLGTTGAFFEPTVLVGARQDMRLMREEIFGPIVALIPFDEADEAIAYANDTRYGLAASVWTADLSTAHRMAAAIRAGTVWVNCHSYFSPELPKGGLRESGWGVENGAQGLESYLETKTVCMVI
jgi:phenylacetaldehyde dehydrogenase